MVSVSHNKASGDCWVLFILYIPLLTHTHTHTFLPSHRICGSWIQVSLHFHDGAGGVQKSRFFTSVDI